MNTTSDYEIKIPLNSVKVWQNAGNGFEETAQEFIADFIEQTKTYILTIPVSFEIKEIMFCLRENSYVIGRMLQVTDNAECPLTYTPMEAVSHDGMDIFETSMPKYHIVLTPKAQTLTIAYSYEVSSRKNNLKIIELIRTQKNSEEFHKAKDQFYQDAIKELCEPQPPHTVIQYVERPPEIQPPREDFYNDYISFKNRYEAITSSTSWKLTKPLRKCIDYIRKPQTSQGDVSEAPKPEPEVEPIIAEAKQARPWIAVHMHLYYEDLLEEFCGYLNHITQAFDLFISCKQGADQEQILQLSQNIHNVREITIKETINRGRDIAPFYVLFRDELMQYECLLHIHSKKSLYTGQEKAEWRHWALDGVLKNEKTVAEILHYLLHAEPKAGLIYGEMTDTLPLGALHWLRNEAKGRELSKRLDIEFDNGMFFYPVGSFFWVRTEAIRPLFDLKLTYEDFDEEKGQIDATMAHALERIIACLVRQRGFHSYIFDAETEKFSLEKSFKSFKTYFSYTPQNIGDVLLNFEIVTFDIFDTLITRLIYEPDDVFRLMERVIFRQRSKRVDFLSFRKEAEQLAREQHGDFCNIHHIYECLPQISVFTKEDALWLKELEIQLEYDLCVPRRDALAIFNRVINAGNRVILISDMYLTKDIIIHMLEKCGFTGYEDIWISCEKGKRKDDDTLWDEFFGCFGTYQTIHVGDNPHSDCQLVGDRKKTNMLWLSPREQFHFSDHYEKYKRFLGTSVENAIVLGYMINGCFYNSPFALDASGVAKIHSIEVAAEGIFAPLFLCFSQFLEKSCMENQTLLFLSREGYFLQKLYKKYCDSFHIKELQNHYFLTSRRAASVAQIRNFKDAKELLKTNYDGRLSTFLAERFGLEQIHIENDIHIKLPGDERVVIGKLAGMADAVLARAETERQAYLSYINELMGKDCEWNNVVLVDIGYAGTIQYYLMKILGQPLDGRYLATEYNIKPPLLSGTCSSLYNFRTSRLFDDTQLFLEAVTAAPHGQLICFESEDLKTTPVYKRNIESCWKSARKFQDAIYHYVETVGTVVRDIHPHFSEELAETILSEVLRAGIFGDEMCGAFTVYDGYCMDGEWKYDEKGTRWVLEKKISPFMDDK